MSTRSRSRRSPLIIVLVIALAGLSSMPGGITWFAAHLTGGSGGTPSGLTPEARSALALPNLLAYPSRASKIVHGTDPIEGRSSASVSGGYFYVNVSGTLYSEKAVGPCCWVDQAVAESTASSTSFVVTGGNGFVVYNGSQSPHPPKVNGLGYLTGAAVGSGQVLLVGQKYSPGGGVLAYSYNATRNKLTALMGLFPRSMRATNTSLDGVAWNGSVFYIVGWLNINQDPTQLLVFTYNPTTRVLSNESSHIPSNFRYVDPCTTCDGSLGIAWTSSGLFFAVGGLGGHPAFGLLAPSFHFSNLTSRFPSTFSRPNEGVYPVNNGVDLSWNGSRLFVEGAFGKQPALFAFDPVTRSLTNLTTLVFGLGGTLVSVDSSLNGLYLCGALSSGGPLLLHVDVENSTVTNLSAYLPHSFGPVLTVTVAGSTLFLSGGSFAHVEYALLVPV